MAAVAAIFAGGLTLTAPAEPATAGVEKYGFRGGSGAGSGWLGSIETSAGSGIFGYCIDPYGTFPSGTTTNAGLITEIEGTTSATHPGHNGTRDVTSAANMKRLNYALSTYGPGATTNVRAAALAAYVYSITSSDHFGDDVYYFIDIRVPSASRQAVKDRYQVIKNATNDKYNETISGRKAKLDIVMDTPPLLTGHVNVSVTPATADGVLTLEGAYRAGTTDPTTNVTNGSRVNIEAIPTPQGQSLYEVRATATFTTPSTYNSNVRMYRTNNTWAQRIIRAGTMADGTFNAAAAVSDPVDGEFEPVVTTNVVSPFVAQGESCFDTLTADVVDDAFPWRRDEITGNYLPVRADGVLYGPFTDPIAQSVLPPVDAPVASTGFVTLNGPGEYLSGAFDCDQSGYYTFVWTISESAQGPLTRPAIPDGYVFVDEFGIPAESLLKEAIAEISTDVTDQTVGLWQPVDDNVTITQDPATGVWPNDDEGAPLPLELTGTAYWVEGTTAPAQSASVPAGATVLGTRSMVVTEPGTYPVAPITPTAATPGYVVWVWEVSEDGVYFMPAVEDFGVPSQMAQVLAPSLETNATDSIANGDEATDVATISGETMGQAAELVFRAYLQPTAGPATCEVDNLIADNAADPVMVTAAGDYSYTAELNGVGTVFWVATLSAADGTVIAEGDCGDPSEVTEVVDFSFVTDATPSVAMGDVARDIATVTGPTPTGATMIFRAYAQTPQPDGTIVPDCSAATLFYTSPAVGLNGTGVYQSPEVETGSDTLYWVATAYDRDNNVLHAGVCGDPEEITNVLDFAFETDATDAVMSGEMARDVAMLEGATPTGATMVFEAFEQTPAADGTITADCSAATRFYTSPAVPLDDTGTYRSPEIQTGTKTLYWVATAYDRDGDMLHAGECGDPEEVTAVEVPDPPIVLPPGLATTGPEVVVPLSAAALIGALGIILVMRKRSRDPLHGRRRAEGAAAN